MPVCSVSGCESTSENSVKTFYQFPINFDLLEDEVIPIKKEILDTDLEAHYNEEAHIKAEPHQDNDFFNDHDYLSGQSSNELDHPMLSLLIIARKKLTWKKKQALTRGVFRSTWSQALENVETRATNKTAMYRNSNGTEEEKTRNEGKYKNAVRVALRKSLETEEQIRERRLKNALRAAYRRSTETPEQKAERRQKDLLRSARRRREETDLQAKMRKYNDAVRAAFRRRNETPEQRAQRKMIDVLRAARRRSMETPEQRETRLKADRERAARRRFFKKLKMPVVHTEQKYFNLKIVKSESGGPFANVTQNKSIVQDADEIQCESKISQTVCTYAERNFADEDEFMKVKTAESVIKSEIQPGTTEIIEIQGNVIRSALNKYKKSEMVWCN